MGYLTTGQGSSIPVTLNALLVPANGNLPEASLIRLTAHKEPRATIAQKSAHVAETSSSDSQHRRNTSLLERAQAIASIGFWELDIDTMTYWGSKLARDIYGLYDDVLSREAVHNCTLPEYRDSLRVRLNDLVANGGIYDVDYKIRRQSDGRVVSVRCQAVFHSDERKVFGVIQDISNLKQTEATLKKLFQAVEQNPASIVITDPSGVIEYVNPKFCSVTGYSADEAIGQNPRILKSDVTTSDIHQDLWSTISSGEVWKGTLCNKSKSGDLFWESVSISPVFDEAGTIIHFVGIKEDITQRVETDTELAALSERATRRLEYLEATHQIELAIRKTTEASKLIPVFVSEFRSALEIDAAAIWVKSHPSSEFTIVAEQRVKTLEAVNPAFSARQCLVTKAASLRTFYFATGVVCEELLPESKIKSYGVLPLIAHGNLIGLLEFQYCRSISPNQEWRNSLETIATVCALALHNSSLFEEVRRTNHELVCSYDATLEGWSRALDLRDQETEGHSQRVTNAAVHFARRLGLPPDDVTQVRRGALLHDVGKLGVPDRILGKPGPLSPEEWDVMKMHPVYAYDWLSRISFLSPALDIPYHHHEHFDGTGYPSGLTGDEIPITARMFTIIDVWDALTHDRPYRQAWSFDKARAYLLSEAGKLVDKDLLDVFLEMVDAGEVEQA
jgi:PAS domain S-box-containing protein